MQCNGINDGSIMQATNSTIVRQMVEKNVIREKAMKIEFKCGVTITQEYVR